MCNIGLASNLIDGGQPRAKVVFKTLFGFTLRRRGLALGRPPSMKSLVNPRVHVRARLKYTAFFLNRPLCLEHHKLIRVHIYVFFFISVCLNSSWIFWPYWPFVFVMLINILVLFQVGARLISHAGSLTNLAKYPASTVQILGAEKALFR